MILIRADANREIGTGHLMRCLSIAEQLNKEEIVFLVADEYGKEIVEKRGFASLVLYTDYKDMENEISMIAQLTCQLPVEMILIDSYYITRNYISEVSELTSVTIIEDVLSEVYPANNILNYNIYAKEDAYRKKYEEEEIDRKPRFLLGAKYAPLREQFLNVNYQIKDKVSSILITNGGADPLNLTVKTLEELIAVEEFEDYTYHVVSGVFNPNIETLRKMKKERKNIIIHENISNMAELMKTCDIAISAAGSTMYELSAVGIPTITYAFVENQDQIANEFAKEKLALYAGDSKTKLEERVSLIKKKVEILVCEPQIRKDMHQALIKKVDGLGAKRIAELFSGENR